MNAGTRAKDFIERDFIERLIDCIVRKKRVGLIAFAAILAGCATNPVAMNTSLLDEPDSSIHIVTTLVPPGGKLFRTGSQGLLHLAINSAVTNPVSTFLAGKDGSEFNGLVDAIERQLQLKNIPVTRHDRPLEYDAIPKT